MKLSIPTPVDTGEHWHKSTSEQAAEFAALLGILGRTVQDRPGEQRVRCWGKAHRRGDRHASMSVDVSRCVWWCHHCSAGGGLVELRRAAGAHGKGSTSGRASLQVLAHLAGPDGDPLALLPAEVVAELRDRTGGHRLDGPLRRNLRRMLAGVHAVMIAADRTTAVRFSALDAQALGINVRLWHQLLPVLPHLGVDCIVGQSGRCLGALSRGEGKGGALRATTVTLNPARLKYSTMTTEQVALRGSVEYFKNRAESTTVAAMACRAPSTDGPSLARRPALAALLADLGSFSIPAGGTDGRTLSPPGLAGRTVRELVGSHGPNVRRTLRQAEQVGLVTVLRLGRDGVVTITDDGARLLDRDAAAGAAVILAAVDVARRRWAAAQDRAADARRRAAACRRRDAQRLADDRLSTLAPWRPASRPGFVIHITTGEVCALADLRGAA